MRFFSVIDAYNWAFKTFFNNFGLLLLVGLFCFVVTNGQLLLSMFMCGKFEGNMWQFIINLSACQQQMGWPFDLFRLALWVVSVWLLFGLFRIAFDFYDYGESSFNRLFSQGDLLLRGLLLVVLYGLLIAFGFVALIIPGIYLASRYALVLPAYVDKKSYIKDTFSYSTLLTQGNRWKILGFLVLGAFLAIIPGVGIVIMPLALVHVYRSLQQEFEDGVTVEAVVETVSFESSEDAMPS